MIGHSGQMGLPSPPVPKTVTLALVDERGTPLGVLPPFDVDFPYWPETTHIVTAARARFGVEVIVLRILEVEPDLQAGGAVTYLAEAASIPLAYAGPIEADLSSQPRRAEYAEPGGPAASLRWAAAALEDLGSGPVTAATQHRTWNLSSIWRLDTPTKPVWLKHVPRFFWHESTVLRWLAGIHQPSVPVLLAREDGRMLLEHIPGEDLYEASTQVRAEIGIDLHRLQAASVEQVGHLIELGVPDLRGARLVEAITAVVDRYGDDDVRLRDLVDGLPARMAEVASYGLPDALVHGDHHPGNVRSNGTNRVIIDWGDSFVGHPAFDILRLTETLDAVAGQALVDAWAARWRATAPGCEPRRALDLLGPVAALRNATVYASFLDPYHAADVPAWLNRAAQLGGTERGSAQPSLT